MRETGERTVSIEQLTEAYRAGEEVEQEVAEEPVVPEEANEEVQEEPVESEETLEVEDDESHAEKTRKGRERAEKLRKTEAENERLAAELAEVQLKLARQEGRFEEMSRHGPEMAPPEPVDPDEPMTRGELEAVLAAERKRTKDEQDELNRVVTEYTSDYKKLLGSIEEDHPHRDKILDLMTSRDPEIMDRYNYLYSDNAKSNFDINFEKAELDVLKKDNMELNSKLSKKNPKVREDEVEGAGVGGVGKSGEKAVKLKPVTDEASKIYIENLRKRDPAAAQRLIERNYQE